MTTILTASGRTLNLQALNTTAIDINDIAYSLSNINRFNGHSMRPISVAEHSLMVCEIAERHFQIKCPAGLLATLLHDAHEYLIGDVSTPVKALLGEDFKAFELRFQRLVLKHFGCWTAYITHQLDIRNSDLHALTSEREQLMHPDGDYWDCQATHPAIDWVKYGPAGQLTAEDWRQLFIERFLELQQAIAIRNQEIDSGVRTA